LINAEGASEGARRDAAKIRVIMLFSVERGLGLRVSSTVSLQDLRSCERPPHHMAQGLAAIGILTMLEGPRG
jgi:hypothetical protein